MKTKYKLLNSIIQKLQWLQRCCQHKFLYFLIKFKFKNWLWYLLVSWITWPSNQASRDFEGSGPPTKVTTLSSLVVIGIAEGHWYKALHLLRDHVIKSLRNLVDAVTTICREDVIFPISMSISISMFITHKHSAQTMCIWDQISIFKFIFCWPYI